MKNNFTFIFLLLLFTIIGNGVCEVHVDYPSFSQTKQAVKDRGAELKQKLEDVKVSGTKLEISEAYGKLGMFYHAHNFAETAAQLYMNSLELYPANSKWLYLLGMTYQISGDLDKMESTLLKALKYNEEYLPTMVYLAELYMQKGDFDTAKKYFQTVLSKAEDYPRALVGMGQIDMQTGNTESAIEKYNKALKQQPQATQINFLLSQAWGASGNLQKAKHYNMLKGKVQAQMFDPLFEKMKAESRSSSYYNDIAVRAYYAGNYIQAEELANTAIQYEPDSPYPQLTLANILMSTHRQKEAIELLENTVKLDDSNPNIKYTLGVFEEITGDDLRAIHWYKKTLDNDPNSTKASVMLASAYMRLGKYDKALTELKRNESIDPNNSFVMQRQASIYAYNNDCGNAMTKIDEAVRSQPKNFAFLLTYVKIAVHCQVDEGFLTNALNAARNMYQINQDNYIVQTLAMIEAKNGNFAEAVDYQKQAVFQTITDNRIADEQSRKKIIQKQEKILDMYMKKQYPQKVFTRDDLDLSPSRINKIR